MTPVGAFAAAIGGLAMVDAVHDLGLVLLGIVLGIPIGAALNAGLKALAPALIRHGWR